MVQPASVGPRTVSGWRRPLLRSGWPLVAAILLGSDAGAQTLGRLFSTPGERKVLDALRKDHEQRAPPDSELRTEPARVTSRLTVNGLVIRERGPDSIWINGERVSRGERTREGFQVQGESGARVRLILPSNAGYIRLKAGQKVDLETGSIRDVEEAEFRITSPPGPPSATGTGEPGP